MKNETTPSAGETTPLAELHLYENDNPLFLCSEGLLGGYYKGYLLANEKLNLIPTALCN